MDTGRGTSYTGACSGVGGQGRDSRGWGVGGVTLGEIPNVGDGAGGGADGCSKPPGHACVCLCNNPA